LAASEDIAWLVSAAGEAALREAAQLAGEMTTRIARLRRSLSPERVRLVVEQLELRKRGREKFPAAERMFFTSIGLEQATDEIVARHKAARMSGSQTVFDLCCGIGGDLLSLGQVVSQASGVDLDPIALQFAEANVRATGLSNVTLRCQNVAEVDLSACEAWHLDPDRRPAGRRTTRVDLHSPDGATIEGMLAKNPNAAIKLAPAAEWPQSWTERGEWEWISRGRQCRQLVAWFGKLASHLGQHRATLLQADGSAHTFTGLPGDDVPVAASLEGYVFEPDASVLAAHLTGELARRHQLAAVAPGIAYWTGPQPIADPLLVAFEVLAILPLDLKRLRAELNARDAGPLEIKVRGLEEDPAQLRKRLGLRGTQPITLLLCRVERRVTAIVARRMSS
jgi:hypothetical protein